MKRIIFLLATLIMAACTAVADNDKAITIDQLPETAKQFIIKHFPSMKASYVKKETEWLEKSYEVIFTNGDKVEFDDKGEWKDVNCKFSQVPEGIVPQQIKSYVSTNYKETKIVEIDRDRHDYEVKLDNGVELKFDLKFNFIGIDH